MPLHLSYRPKKFKDMIGNKSVILSLESIFKREDKPHSFLFHGSRGCGKSSLARIIANKLNCHPKSLIEIDAGSERGVETADQIVKSIRYAPVFGDVKVYIIDEVHATSKKFQDALLKILEDTPKHIYFILCTTEANKLRKAIVSRCSTYQVSLQPKHNIITLLNRVLDNEDMAIPEDVKNEIATCSEGCPRESLVMLDQVIDMEESEMLGAVKSVKDEEGKLYDLFKLLQGGKEGWSKIANIIKTTNTEPEGVRAYINRSCESILLKSENGDLNKCKRVAIILNEFRNQFLSDRTALTLACYCCLFC